MADSVAHFHLSNGARLERINTSADLSENGRLSFGVMVNYLYEPDKLELNHEHYIESGHLALAPSMAAPAKRIDTAWANGIHADAAPVRNTGPLPTKE